MLVMDHALAGPLCHFKICSWFYPGHWNFTPIHSFWSQAGSCCHQNHSTI